MNNYIDDINYEEYDYTLEGSYAAAYEDPAASRTMKLLLVCGIAAFVSGFLYAITGNLVISAGPVGLTCLLCALFHTPLAFIFLYSALPFEMLVRPSEYFSISKLMGLVVLLSYILTRLGARIHLPKVVKWLLLFGFFCFLSVFWALAQVHSLISVATILLHIGLVFMLVALFVSGNLD